MFSSKGQKGFSILPNRIGDRFCFVMQGRSCDIEDKSGKEVVFQQVIHYCPWCGTELQLIIDQNRLEMKELVESNRGLILKNG
ncbi:MAG: hypothetical protein KDD12_21275 [Lewinella sp.]|nr:hypothetical protein [Lewinella sp.]